MALLWLLLNFSFSAAAQEAAVPATVTPSIEQRLELLETTVSQIRTNQSVEAPAADSKFIQAQPDQTFTGMGPSASKIYFQPNTTTWGLSSEFMTFNARHGTDSSGSNAANRLNVTSVAPTLAARLHKRVLFNSQLLIENGGSEASNTVTLQKGQVIVIQAYADWLTGENQQMGVRIGHQLVPMGWVNTLNEPITYFGVLKPELERELIPSTWHENGVSLWVNRPRAEIQVGVFNSLDAAGLQGDTFLAGGRSHGQNARASDFMGVLRLNAKGENATVGASIAFGQTSQNSATYMRGSFNLGEAHVQLRIRGLELFGQFAQGQLQDADSISVVNATTMGSKANGYSVQAALELGMSKQPVWIFARHSHYNLHAQVPSGFTKDPSLDKTTNTIGLSYFPLPNWVVKTDYAFKKSAEKNEEDEFNIGTGISF